MPITGALKAPIRFYKRSMECRLESFMEWCEVHLKLCLMKLGVDVHTQADTTIKSLVMLGGLQDSILPNHTLKHCVCTYIAIVHTCLDF